MARIRDIANEAKTMPRFDFIAHFVQGATRTKGQREPVAGMQVKRLGDGWTYTFMGKPATRPLSTHALYEEMRRNELNFYVRQAEEFRIDVLSETVILPPGTVSA
jgi:hypothetical protein